MALTVYTYPTSAELRQIEQDLLPRLMADRPIFQLMPPRDVQAADVIWEQLDNFTGLQQLRGIDGAPLHVQRTGMSRFIMEAGIYGEYTVIDERAITRMRGIGTYDAPIDLTALVAADQQKLLQRRLDRMELIGWTLFATGTFSVASPTGGVVHTDTFPIQTFTAGTAWSNATASAPLADFRAVQLLSAGHSVSFGADSTAYMNRITANRLFSNFNPQDLYGRRTQGLGTYNSPAQINELLAGDDLPTVVVYDKGYLTDDPTPVFARYIPTGVVVVVGRRDSGVPVAEYQMVRNAQNPGLAPGAYTRVVDPPDRIPRRVEVHDGHNGGPAIMYPSAIVRMNV